MPVRVIGSGSSQPFFRALVDPGSIDTIFPFDVQQIVGATLRPATGHVVRWRGTSYPLRFGDVHLEISQQNVAWRWPALVGFSTAPLPFPLLGHYGFLQYFDATFYGDRLVVGLNLNASYSGTTS